MSWYNFEVNDDLPQCTLCKGYDDRVVDAWLPGEIVCLACAAAAYTVVTHEDLKELTPDDFIVKICEACDGHGGREQHMCYECDASGRIIRLKPMLVRLAEVAE